ncbi:Protein of unknown function [Gryllus bimaculatus]|nr:Protein of unknown function [Gryllus bimaculatus]
MPLAILKDPWQPVPVKEEEQMECPEGYFHIVITAIKSPIPSPVLTRSALLRPTPTPPRAAHPPVLLFVILLSFDDENLQNFNL